jgi:hypothetical protein
MGHADFNCCLADFFFFGSVSGGKQTTPLEGIPLLDRRL